MSWCGSRAALAAVSAARSTPKPCCIDLKLGEIVCCYRTVKLTRENRHGSIASVNPGHSQIVRAKLSAGFWFQSYRRFAYREFAPRGNEAVSVLSYTRFVSLNKKRRRS
jgi:hypothetical protein